MRVTMPFWKQLLLTLYYHGTYPVRVWTYWQEKAEGSVPVIVLFYHRVADDRATAWTVSNTMFLRHIRWLEEGFQFISLDEAQRRIRRGYNRQPCVAITFDDGYSDNCRQAIPLLIKERIPCTYFVTAHNVLCNTPFSHDVAANHRFAPNTLEQLRAMAAAGIEIGAHTYTHPDLGPVTDPSILHQEMVAAKTALEDALDRSIRYFAFPFGQHANLNPAAFALARQAGYAGVCSAYGGYNFPGDDAFHLQRIGVDDNMIRLKNWATGDPRKRRTQRFDYHDSDCRTEETEECNPQEAVAPF